MAMPMSFLNHHGHHPHSHPNGAGNNPNTGTPNNSFAGTIDPGLLQMTMNQNMSSLFPSSSASSINSLTNAPTATHTSVLGRSGLGSKRNSSNSNSNQNNVKQETGSPDFMAAEMDFGEHRNMLSPGSSSPLNSPRNDFDSPDDFNHPGTGTLSHAKPLPMNIQNQHSYGDSPGNGSLYSPVESDFFPEGDFSLPSGSRALDMKFGRHMSLPSANPFHSMSMPVPRSDWFGTTDGGHIVGSFENQTGLQFPQGEMTGMMSSLFEEDGEQKGNNRALLMNEKRRRRRESHNAVERRRRDNINEKIQELSTLLPEIYVDSANKPNKGVILRKSVDYIRHLQQLVTSQNNRNQELEAQLRARNGAGSTGDENNANGVNGAGPGPQLQQDFGMMRIVSGGGNGGQN
ncbi:hypothetical protein BGX30_013586 [Mortierella sp. GBA39]|nr:hypothetical protein BGX30_013586 [Mortierella sp. GBA39]